MTDYGEHIMEMVSHTSQSDIAEGFPCHLSDSAGRHLLNYKIYGDSVQEGTPSSATPIDIISVGDKVTDETDENYGKYKIPIAAYGKNLIKCSYTSDVYSPGVTVNKDFSLTVNPGKNTATTPINVKQSNAINIPKDGVTLTASCKNISSVLKMVIRIKKATTSTYDYYTLISGFKTLTLSKGDIIQVYLQIPAGGTISNTTILYPQLELGTSATSYEPYINPLTTNIYLDEPLRKVGEYSDYIDFKRQVVVRNVKKFVIPTTISWNSWSNTENGRCVMLYQLTDKLYGDNITTLGHFNRGTVSQTYVSLNHSDILCAYNSSYCCYWYPNYTQFGLDGSEEMSVANTALQTWLNSAGETYFTYITSNPTETKVSLPVIPVPKGNIFIGNTSTLSAANIYAKYFIK